MPVSQLAPSTSTSPATPQHSSALHTLITNLRLQDSDGEMVQTTDSLSDTELLHELRTRVDQLASGLSPRDAELARTLASLLSHFHRLSFLNPLVSSSTSSQQRVASWNNSPATARPSGDPYSTLRRQVSDFQLERSWSHNRAHSTGDIGVAASVEASLLWSLVDDELEAVLSLCRSHGQISDPFADALPPEYEAAGYEHDSLPDYEPAGFADVDLHGKASHKPGDKLERISTRLSDNTSEKMKMDFEAVTLAIDRLYLVAPQLHNQRVELKKSKVEEMEKAQRKGKQRRGMDGEMQMRELDRMVELIGKASDRKMNDQAVTIDGEAMRQKMARARQKELEKVRAHSASSHHGSHFPDHEPACCLRGAAREALRRRSSTCPRGRLQHFSACTRTLTYGSVVACGPARYAHPPRFSS